MNIPISSPHVLTPKSTASVMRLVIVAAFPGLAALLWFFGNGVLINIILASVTALLCEALVIKLRRRPVLFYLSDYSALVTALLLGLALPPYCPWYVVVTGVIIAIIIAKHLYGGMGFNLFNPAMVGYVALLISFPVEMTRWGTPRDLLPEGGFFMSNMESLRLVFTAESMLDGYTMATPLDVAKQNATTSVDELYQSHDVFLKGKLAGAGWEWVNLGFFLGGLFLLYKKVFTWHAPVGMLLSLSLMAVVFYDADSASSGSVIFHLLSGGTMLGAFFIVTDPVTSAASRRGRLIYGAATGFLVYVIRVWGNYPDAVAFSVLLMNFVAPFIDYFTLPRIYGHSKSRRAIEDVE